MSRYYDGATHAYVGRVPRCGCLVAAHIDPTLDGEEKKATAKFVADLIRQGLEVDRVEIGVVRLELQRCPHQDRADDPQGVLL